MAEKLIGPVVWYVQTSIQCSLGDRDSIREVLESGYSSAVANARVQHRTNGVLVKALECGRLAKVAALADWLVVPPLAAWRAERAAWPTWRVSARYSDGGYWGDDIKAKDATAARSVARSRMVEAGEIDRDGIEIVDCDPVDPLADSAKAHAVQLLNALVWLVDDMTDAGEDRDPATGAEYDSVTAARAVIASVRGRIPENDQPTDSEISAT